MVFWQSFINDIRPEIRVVINGISFNGLIDTGADVTIISKDRWFSDWPLQKVSAALTGIGTLSDIYRSMECEGSERKITYIKLLVADTAINLWRRDFSQWGLSLNSGHNQKLS